MDTIFALPRFNDMHGHFRQGAETHVVKCSGQYCQTVLAMPNLSPPITTGPAALAYREQLQSHLKQAGELAEWTAALTTIKLLDSTTPEMIKSADAHEVVAAKLYPRGATHNSDDGVLHIRELAPVFEEMQGLDMALCVHGELPHAHPWSTVLDWERDFFTTHFEWLWRSFPRLRIVMEHVTTSYAVERVIAAGPRVAATITPHHLLMTIDDVLAWGLQPRNYCKPVAKTPRDRDTLRHIVMSGHPKFFLGSDSAPHDVDKKYCDGGCAGCFTAPILPELVAEFYHRCDMDLTIETNRLTACRYVTENAAEFYGLPSDCGLPELQFIRHRWKGPTDYALQADGSTYIYPPFASGWPLQFWYIRDLAQWQNAYHGPQQARRAA